MATKPRNDYDTRRRAIARAYRRAVRHGSPESQWLTAIAVGMTGNRY